MQAAQQEKDAYAFNSKVLDKAALYVAGDRKTAATVMRKFTENYTHDPRATELLFGKIADLNKAHMEGNLGRREFVREMGETVDEAFLGRPETSRKEISRLFLDLYLSLVIKGASQKMRLD